MRKVYIIIILAFYGLSLNAQAVTCLKEYPNSLTNYFVGTNPNSIALGDLNADSKPDFVTANYGSNNISVILNNGNGTYASAVNYLAGTNPNSIAIGDINGDGFLDLVFTNRGDGNVSTMLNSGTGTFSNKVDYYVANSPTSVAIGNLNADGSPDLAVTSYFYNNGSSSNNVVSVFLNTGTGTFVPKVNYSVGSQPCFVTIGDLNMDGKSDLAIANYGSSNISILKNDGTGAFLTAQNYQTGVNPISVALGDLNSDGSPDIAVANAASANVCILKNNGTGTLLAAVYYSTGTNPTSVAIGDLNGDTHPDLAVTNKVSGNVSILNNTGSGTFTTAVNYALGQTPQPISIAIGDLNGDGKNDLAIANYYNYNVCILNNDGKGTFTSAAIYNMGAGNYSLAMGDLNGDGYNDLVVANYSSSLSVMLNTGTGTFAATVNYAVGGSAVEVAIGDLNGDGKPDLAVANESGGNASILLNAGNGAFLPAINYSTGSNYSVAMGDLNGDSYPDLVFANFEGNGFTIILNNGNGTFGPPVSRISGNYPQGATVGDINNDTYLDIIVANTGSNNISVFFNNGTGIFATQVNYSTLVNPMSVSLGDFNGDGNTDLAVACFGSNKVCVLKNNGTGTFMTPVNYPVGLNPTTVFIGDVDGDSIPDIATANYHDGNGSGSSTFSILKNTGTGTFSAAENYTVGIHPRSIVIGDLNGDGHSDIAVTNTGPSNSSTNSVSVLMNYTANITAACQGNSMYVLHATKGGVNYLWSPGGSTADSLVLNTIGSYTLTMSSPTASCTTTRSITITSICCTAPVAYTWFPNICAGHSITIGNHIYNTNGVYTDTLISYQGCDSTVTTHLTVLPANIFTQSLTVCAGHSITIGNHTYTTNGTYSDTLIAFNTCDSIVITHLIVNPLPVLAITDPATVCSPTTIDLSLSAVTSGSSLGTLSYWQDSSANVSLNTSYYTIIDTSETYYIKLDSGGCFDVKPVIVTINNDCIWPGDANHDSIVNNFDLLPIGLYYSQTGSPRTSISNTWQAYQSPDWGTLQTNGADIKHVDCNGDGLIDNNDTLAVNLNFSLTHAIVVNNYSDVRTGDPAIYFITSSNLYNAGDWVNVEVWIGNSTLPVSNLYGIALNISYNTSLVESGTESLTYPNSIWLGTPGTNAITVAKTDPLAATSYGAITRIDHINANGFGKVADFKFQVKTNLQSPSTFHLSVSNYKAIDAAGLPIVFAPSADSIVVYPLTTAIVSEGSIQEFTISPNPFSTQTILTFRKEQKHTCIKIMDVFGKEIKTINFTGKQLIIEKAEMQKGIYFVQLIDGNNNVLNRKIIVQ